MAAASWPLWGVLALVALFMYRQSQTRNRRKLPPGPKPLPLLGNIRDFPPDGTLEYLHWLKHKDLYGGISSVTVMGMTLVIVHDNKMAHDLLDQTAVKTSGRPTMVMANTLCGYESIVICQSYTPRFRWNRKFLHRELGTKASAARFHGAQEVEMSRQLVRTLKEPEKLLEHYKVNTAATALKMAYGYSIEPHKPDVLVELIERALKEFSLASIPMAWAVDIIPALQYLPENFPGASFKKTARKWRKSIQSAAYIPYSFVRSQMAASTHRPSYVSRLVQQLESENGKLTSEDEQAITWSAATLYGAAADTTVMTLTSFTVAMLKFPEVQLKAQEEIDRVIGGGRFPTFEDRERLPYMNASIKEALRW